MRSSIDRDNNKCHYVILRKAGFAITLHYHPAGYVILRVVYYFLCVLHTWASVLVVACGQWSPRTDMSRLWVVAPRLSLRLRRSHLWGLPWWYAFILLHTVLSVGTIIHPWSLVSLLPNSMSPVMRCWIGINKNSTMQPRPKLLARTTTPPAATTTTRPPAS
jgi:hypothetical protein